MRKKRFEEELGLSAADASQLTQSRTSADYFESALQHAPTSAKGVANWINVELASYLNKSRLDIEESRVDADTLGRLVALVSDGTISGAGGKTLLQSLWDDSTAIN